MYGRVPARAHHAEQTMDPQATNRQERLDSLIAELSHRPTSEMVIRCLEASGIDPRIEADRVKVDAAMAGAWAFNRMLSYLDRLRSLNEERMQIGMEIAKHRRHPYRRSEAEVEAAADARIMAPHLAGKQEVVFNFFCASVQHIRSLLIVLAEAVEYPIPQDDLDFLDQFRFLRNHYEHWYERLPGKKNEMGLFSKRLTADEYTFRGGLDTDEKNRIVVVEPKKPLPVAHIVDVTNAGVERIERIVQGTVEGVRTKAVENVRAYYVDNPTEAIPPPESVDRELLISVGGGNESRRN
jgi:hypothetical protein